MTVPLERADQAFLVFMALMAGNFVLLFILINLLLHVVAIRPVVQMATVANDISLGKTDVPYYSRDGRTRSPRCPSRSTGCAEAWKPR